MESIRERIYYLIKNSSVKEVFSELFLKEGISAIFGFVLALLLTNFFDFVVALIIFVLIAVVVSILLSSDNHQFDVLSIIRNEQRKENWIEVIRLGYPLSRALWLSGRYKLRVEIGEMLRNAASKAHGNISIGESSLSNDYILASVLIDDLGWTRFELGQKTKAVNSIKEGIRISQACGYWELAIKGYRHLIGINQDDVALVEFYFEEIDKLLPNIDDEKTRMNTYAGILYAKAEHLLRVDQDEKAKEYALLARDKYLAMEDYERYVKSFYLIGEILMKGGTDNYQEAQLIISEGIEYADKWQRKERYVKLVVLYIKLSTNMVLCDDCYTNQEFFSNKASIDILYKNAIDISKEIQNKSFENELKQEYRTFIKTAKKQINNQKE